MKVVGLLSLHAESFKTRHFFNQNQGHLISQCVKCVPFHPHNLPKDTILTYLQDPGIYVYIMCVKKKESTSSLPWQTFIMKISSTDYFQYQSTQFRIYTNTCLFDFREGVGNKESDKLLLKGGTPPTKHIVFFSICSILGYHCTPKNEHGTAGSQENQTRQPVPAVRWSVPSGNPSPLPRIQGSNLFFSSPVKIS